MNIHWQDIAAGIIVASAAIYTIMRIFHIGPWKKGLFLNRIRRDT